MSDMSGFQENSTARMNAFASGTYVDVDTWWLLELRVRQSVQQDRSLCCSLEHVCCSFSFCLAISVGTSVCYLLFDEPGIGEEVRFAQDT